MKTGKDTILPLSHFLAEGERLLFPAWPRTPAEGPGWLSSLQDGVFVYNCCSTSSSEADHLLMPATSCCLLLAFPSPLRIPRLSGTWHSLLPLLSLGLYLSGAFTISPFHLASPWLSLGTEVCSSP